MPAIAVPSFALVVWMAGYLVGRDPGRPGLRWAGAALGAYAIGIVTWTVAPGSAVAEVLVCLPALGWAAAVVSLLPLSPRERRPIDRGALVLGALFLVLMVLLPGAGRLVALTPLLGALVMLLRQSDAVVPRRLPLALSVMAFLYAVGLVVLLAPDLPGALGDPVAAGGSVAAGDPTLALAAVALDLLAFGYLMAVEHALATGERLRPHLRRSLATALAVTAVAGVPAVLTILSAPDQHLVVLLQFVPVGVLAGAAGLTNRVRRLLDRLALAGDGRLRGDRAVLFVNADALLRRRDQHRLTEIGEPEFLRLTRRALADFNDLDRLSRSPLTDLPVVARRLAGRGDDQPRARARELRAVLREAVSALRPPGPFDTGEDWRYYNALQFCGVLGLNPYARRLRTDGLNREGRVAMDWFRRYVERDTMRQWQREAAMTVAGRLWAEMNGADITTRSS
ncbi:hypothetical protein [Actinoplanes sp. NPDC051851]|uniref:hypothetical protein n=1 Tax=Actinoplanes sp. NPDC051851 TaxID=3154753 RepID=UPI0034332A1D